MRVRWRGFELPTRVALEGETATATYGKFFAEPFERGYGTTIGNSLRRVLLSSLEGAAVVSVRIDGVAHEFATVEGVYEDVTDIVLNVKNLLVRMHEDEPVVLRIEKKGKGDIRASDIIHDAKVEMVNPDLHIATVVGDDGKFNAEFLVKKGRGYKTAEELAEPDAAIGVIPIDAIFSPVRRVRYVTENTRVGKMTNYDRLILELWTDGTVYPEEALVEASLVLRKHLNPFVKYFEIGEELAREERQREELEADFTARRHELEERLKLPVSVLDLSVRAENCLSAAGVENIGDLVTKTEEELLAIRNLGKNTLRELKKKLGDMELSFGLQLPQEVPVSEIVATEDSATEDSATEDSATEDSATEDSAPKSEEP